MPVSLGSAIRLGAVCILSLLFAAGGRVSAEQASAQTPATPPNAPDAPVRDSAKTTAKPAARAVIRGRVVTLDTGAPLRRAYIRIFGGPEMSVPRAAFTDAQGNYEIKNLPAGRYEVHANKGGYVQVAFGQRAPHHPGRPLVLADGQTLDKIDFQMPRGGVITGRVVDELGEPVIGTTVKALVSRYFAGRRRLVQAGYGQTNDIGQYRMFGLPPGEYYITAPGTDSSAGNEGMTDNPTGSGYAPTYYPGTPSLAEAERVTMPIGGELNADMQLIPTRVCSISGTVVDQNGRPAIFAFVSLQPRDEMLRDSSANVGAGTAGAQGAFALSNIVPGAYYLIGTSIDEPMSSSNKRSMGWMPITVTGQDLEGVRIVTSKGATIKGRVAYEGGTRPVNTSPIGLHVGCQASGEGPLEMTNASPAKVDEQGRFEVTGVYRECLIRTFPTPEGWGIGSVTHDTTDVTDRPLAIKDAETIADVNVLLTNRLAKLTGSVTDDDKRPAKDYVVIVFPEDASKLGPQSRFVRSARADQQGQFKMSGLPPGEYLAAAVDTLEDGAETDPEFLDRLRPSAVPLRLSDEGQQTVALKVIKPMP